MELVAYLMKTARADMNNLMEAVLDTTGKPLGTFLAVSVKKKVCIWVF